MPNSMKTYRRKAKTLLRAAKSGDSDAQSRLGDDPQLADALHAVARDAGFASWPKLKATVEAATLDRTDRIQRLKMALFKGQDWQVDTLLAADPDLSAADLGVQTALYDLEAVQQAIAADPDAATRAIGARTPILHLAFSKHLKAAPEKEADMLAIAEALVAAGADVDDGFAPDDDNDHTLSALYGALGHADNMPLARFLLEKGANPNDDESLYHATELGHRDGLRLLLDHGADPANTNALLRALDFNDHEAVSMLLAAGADPQEKVMAHPSAPPREKPTALHQAARRGCDARMATVLIDGGADMSEPYQGVTPYAYARAFGNDAVARVIAERGGSTEMRVDVARLARLADGQSLPKGEYIDPARLPEDLRGLVRECIGQKDRLPFLKRLIAAGLEYDRPDASGVTPVQISGWLGLPEEMAYFLSLKPDLSHVNGFGGNLLSTIIHGSENAAAEGRDHIECARLALAEGVALPRRAITLAGDPGMAAFLAYWGEKHPGQVVDEGIV